MSTLYGLGRRVAVVDGASTQSRSDVTLRVLLAALSGVLYVFAQPPHTLWPLAFVSWVPLLVALDRVRPGQAAWLGAVQGVVANAIGLAWLPSVVHTFGQLRPSVCVAISALVWSYQAGSVASASALYARARALGWARAPAFSIAMAASESLFPFLFPAFTGAQLHAAPVFLQLAELGGPVLVGVPFTLFNAAITEGMLARVRRRPVPVLALLLGLLAPGAAAIFGLVRSHEVSVESTAAPALRVGVVQPNTPHKRIGLRTAIRTYRAATTQFTEPLDLVVWPETAIPAVIQRDVLEKTLDEQVLHAPDYPEAPPFAILSGAMLGRDTQIANSAVLVTPDGKLQGTYDKVHPLVFGEYVPFADRFPVLDTLIPNAGRLTAGRSDQTALPFQGHRITPLICYEDVVPSFTDDAVRATDGELLVDLTNDSWFGDSAAAAMHLAVARMRAIEHRRYLVQAAASGVSAFVDPTGRVMRQAGVGQSAALVDTIHWLHPRTIDERVGEAPRAGLALAVLALALVRVRQKENGQSTRRELLHGQRG